MYNDYYQDKSYNVTAWDLAGKYLGSAYFKGVTYLQAKEEKERLQISYPTVKYIVSKLKEDRDNASNN